jgi:hypothetical protein
MLFRHYIIIGPLIVVAASLILMLGTFWIIDFAPLTFFVGTGIVYGLLSSQKKRNKVKGLIPIPTSVPLEDSHE